MSVTCLNGAICLAVFFLSPEPALPQAPSLPTETSSHFLQAHEEAPILDELRFTGLRRIAPAAVAVQIASHPGDPFDSAIIDKDVRTLARMGWFESIQVEALYSTAPFPLTPEHSKRVALIFHLEEFSFLSKVDYSGSRLLTPKQLEKMLEDKKLAPGLGKPADPAALQSIAFAIRAALNGLGHPDAGVRITREEAANATVRVRFEITDGPLLRVRRVVFDGHPGLSAKLLRAQMHNVAPWKPLASWLGKNAFTRDAFEFDRQRILTYYQDHGFPEARVGVAQVAISKEASLRWLPWPHKSAAAGLTVSIPVEAGPLYHFKSIAATHALQQAAKGRAPLPRTLFGPDSERPYSQDEIDKL